MKPSETSSLKFLAPDPEAEALRRVLPQEIQPRS